MIRGRLLVVVAAIARRSTELAARAGHDALERLAPGSILTARQAAELDAAIAADKSRREYLGPYTPPSIDPDRLHHGSWELRICLAHGRVSVVPPAGDCPECDPTPACGDAAGDSPAAVSDGLATTAPAAGHPNLMREAVEADVRMSALIDRHNALMAAAYAPGAPSHRRM